jgi:AbrB family looped-hinge helix DNA binding protein
MKAVVTITHRGAVTLPTELRQRDNIKAGEEFEVERIARGEYLLRRKNGTRNEGLVSLLLACPTKDWFKPLGRIASTRDIPVSRGR